jgi:hypothetical protein
MKQNLSGSIMSKTVYNVFFKGRKKLSPDNKRLYKILGTIEIGIGSVCLLISRGEPVSIYLSLLFVGIFSILYGLIGRYWLAEKNYIIITLESIEFKNLSQKPRIIPRDTIQDVMIESNKAVFLSVDQRFKLYDFSVFNEKALKEINVELLKVKLEANKKQ